NISGELFAGYHPVAVAQAIAGKDLFVQLATQVSRDLLFPGPGEEEKIEYHIRTWYTQELLSVIGKALKKEGVLMADILKPPESPEEGTQTYCPRCHCCYMVEEGECAECGIPLIVFSAS
ncbi:MAG: hypothetical protein GY754_24335, partial [bacterium]|nr:hypothetical protein [bacterium]